jgi:hypothetical protein
LYVPGFLWWAEHLTFFASRLGWCCRSV